MKKILLLLPFLLTACLEVRNVVTPGDKPVIEAYLAPGHPVSMKIYTEIPYSEEDSVYSEPLTGLSVTLTGNNGQRISLSDNNDGIYTSQEPLGEAGLSYTMSFQHNGRLISAETTLPERPIGFRIDTTVIYRVSRSFTGSFLPGQGGFEPEEMTEVNLSWQNPGKVYHFVAATVLDENAAQIVTRSNDNGVMFAPPNRRFNNEPVQGESAVISSQSFEYFGRHAIILYKLNPDYAALYQNQSSTSQNISTPVSTITNGLGIFTGINADTLLLTVRRK